MSWPANAAPLDPDLAASDKAAGFEITPDFQRFSQMDDIFTRAFWDDEIRSKDTDAFFASYRMEAAPRRGEGFSQRDFALRNASWLISDVISNRGADTGKREGFQAAIDDDTPVAPVRADLGTPEEESASLKRIARLFGADLVGITQIDMRWHYTDRPDTRSMTPVPNDLPDGLSHVIVMGHAMDFDLVETYPSALAGAATGREYSHEAAIVMQVAAYIRNLGYQAVASMNDTAVVGPYAVEAGLGEDGRNQMVLTPEFGPRVRGFGNHTRLQSQRLRNGACLAAARKQQNPQHMFCASTVPARSITTTSTLVLAPKNSLTRPHAVCATQSAIGVPTTPNASSAVFISASSGRANSVANAAKFT